MYSNLKTALGQRRSPSQIKSYAHRVFMNLAQSFVEMVCVRKIHQRGIEGFVTIEGRQHIDAAMGQKRGLILMAIHSGNWELGNALNSTLGYPYHVVANIQPKTPFLNDIFNECRRINGGHIINPGRANRDIIKALKDKEMVGLVFDQGGQRGVSVNFLGKTASMSTGGVHLALKYNCPICPVWISRNPHGGHTLTYFPAIKMKSTGNIQDDIKGNVQVISDQFSGLLEDNPTEYLWFYKVYKYSNDVNLLILDDGTSAETRGYQDRLSSVCTQMQAEGRRIQETIAGIAFKTSFKEKLFQWHAKAARFFSILRSEEMLKFYLTPATYNALIVLKADIIVSSGTKLQGLNFILSKIHLARSIT